MTSDELWVACGLQPGLDLEYCQRHQLTPGISDLIHDANAKGLRVVSLTNDVSAWSRVLRARFRLDAVIAEWIVSADIGVRKPDMRAYTYLLDRVGCAAGQVVFLDDRLANIDAARSIGIDAHLFVSIEEARAVAGLTH